MGAYPYINVYLRQLYAEVSVDDTDATIAWCQTYGLIAMENNCKNCHQATDMVKRSGKDGSVEGHVRWHFFLANQISVWQQLWSLFMLGRTKC